MSSHPTVHLHNVDVTVDDIVATGARVSRTVHEHGGSPVPLMESKVLVELDFGGLYQPDVALGTFLFYLAYVVLALEEAGIDERHNIVIEHLDDLATAYLAGTQPLVPAAAILSTLRPGTDVTIHMEPAESMTMLAHAAAALEDGDERDQATAAVLTNYYNRATTLTENVWRIEREPLLHAELPGYAEAVRLAYVVCLSSRLG